ncbi:MAG: macro domain-containing protein [Bacteroidota bacterium]|nr:macro domain-containing protein [Bacteroidota bacterium]
MIQLQTGNLLDSNAEALVNTVNTVGIMGKGIALQFKNMFPTNYKQYAKACKNGEVQIGKLFVTEETTLLGGRKIIINFPTKTDWRKPAEYIYIEQGLKALARLIIDNQIHSVAIPPLGTGNGGLDWNKVKAMIELYLSALDCDIQIYQPNTLIQEAMKKERVKLTPARAMLLAVLFDLVRDGEFVSEFAAEKVAYFLQRFGAEEYFKLDFQPNFYGPYSGKVKRVLYYLNGSYITGYSSMDKKPFEELGIMTDGEKEVTNYLNENETYKAIVEKTKKFLAGYYSSFALELLSTVDFIKQEKKVSTVEEITENINQWSSRKSAMFNKPQYIQLAVGHLQSELA